MARAPDAPPGARFQERVRRPFAFLRRALLLFVCLAPPPAVSRSIDVLWYTYAHPESIYVQKIRELAGVVHTLPRSNGLRWKLTFLRPESPAPAFGEFNVLVIHGAELGYTGRYFPALGYVDPRQPRTTPDYRGILLNRKAIEAARGERTVISGSDADVHTITGDTGNAPADPTAQGRRVTCHPVILAPGCWDGALGHLVNAVNWAGSGRGLGIVSLVAAEYPGALWWVDHRSFLRRELKGHVTVWDRNGTRENNPVIPEAMKGHPLNAGLTSRGLSNWRNSFHAGFAGSIPGYFAVVNSSRYPGLAVVIAREKPPGAGITGAAPAASGGQSRPGGSRAGE
ncbi:MAG: PEP-CTERM sorting domain-containing protein [Burkholderiales bacterium]|nr:PEP-CTERM sorting domain-containing protein [Burkholderiales bacterium]